MESCRTQHAVIDALQNPPLPHPHPPFALLPWGFVISSIKIYSRYSFISDVIGPLGTLWNLLKRQFHNIEDTLERRQEKKKMQSFSKVI